MRFSDHMVAEVSQTFWAAMARGEFITGAAAEAGTYRAKGRRWLRGFGGGLPGRRACAGVTGAVAVGVNLVAVGSIRAIACVVGDTVQVGVVRRRRRVDGDHAARGLLRVACVAQTNRRLANRVEPDSEV